MGPVFLLPALPALTIEWIRLAPELVRIGLSSQAATCTCPSCRRSSARVHGHYVRKLRDAPAHGRAIELHIGLRRFICESSDCAQQTFAEQMPELMRVQARKTCRLETSLREIGLAAGGEAGARLARKLGMPISPATLLRLIRRAPLPRVTTPRVLGVDDWAFHRGQRYGTILCDLETHQPVDLLPDRSATTLAAWLQEHPGTELISRDRGGEYARGAALGAPQARQVADRFHLARNLIEAFERGLDRRNALFAEAVDASQPISLATPVPARGGAPVGGPAQNKPATSKRQQRHEQSRNRRKACYDQVKDLQGKGVALRQIALQLGLNSHTVQRYARAGQFPERASRPIPPTVLDSFVPYLKERWEQGCHASAKLHRELKERGFTGSIHMVRRQLGRWHDPLKQPAGEKPQRRWHPSARRVAWMLLKGDAGDASPSSPQSIKEQEAFLAALHRKWPELTDNVWLVREFSRVLRQDDPAELEAWVALTGEPGVMPEITQFARNLRNDWEAVVQAVRQPWSNGQVEGQVNRLKNIKRQMYGRANFDLLKARVLQMN
jgi:transposase